MSKQCYKEGCIACVMCSVRACVADTQCPWATHVNSWNHAMHNFKEFAIVIQKNDGAIF